MEKQTPAAATPASTLAMARIISSQAPVVMLDGRLAVIAASASFYRDFAISRANSARLNFSELGGGEWNVPQLMMLLRATASGSAAIEAYEMDLVRPGLPPCCLLLSANKLDYQGDDGEVRIVLTVTDVTAVRLADKQKVQLLQEKQVLMQELQHRVANSLQIIASVLMQSARKVNSEETRRHLKDAHLRVMSVATLQRQLAIVREGEVDLRDYFTELCESISASMIADPGIFTLVAKVDDSKVDARISASLGLIVTELVVNSLKHAFPASRHSGTIVVEFRTVGTGWILRVSDDGVGFPIDANDSKPGLGEQALSRPLPRSWTLSSPLQQRIPGRM
jgi:two-component system, sensor histidine kinase PdtaS